jgi:hypothetical protein
MVLVGYFLARCWSGEKRTGPPIMLGKRNWGDVWQLFYSHLGDGRDFIVFRNSLQNTRDTFDSFVDNGREGWKRPLNDLEQSIFDQWRARDCAELWAKVRPYADLSSGSC